MKFERSAGILLHPTSLPGKYGIGDLGPEAFRFIDFLEAAGQRLWQVLPLGPTGYGDSPYQCFSAFAGNHYLISIDFLTEEKLLALDDLKHIPDFNPHVIDYGKMIGYKMSLLRKAFINYSVAASPKTKHEFESFEKANSDWLENYGLFMSLKGHHGGSNWSEWKPDAVHRKPKAIAAYKTNLANEIAFHKLIQFLFFKQWRALKQYANVRGIKVIGDLPIFIAYDSADAWADKQLFTIDADGKLVTMAGVPPDYFSPTGQLWGNPLCKWKEMEKNGYFWWRRRITKLLELVDIIRIDHFRGFDAYWEIPGSAPTAETGKWVKGPGKKFFRTLQRYLGDLPIIAEDLGLITKSVVELRDTFGFPGMKILQFAFGSTMEKKFLPHNYTPNCAVYTGSHDNDTTRGYFKKAKHENGDIYASIQRYLNYYGNDIQFELIRAAYASTADTLIIPMQDVLNLGSEARMNYPGKPSGNWTWRFTWDQVPENLIKIYKDLTEVYERPPKGISETS